MKKRPRFSKEEDKKFVDTLKLYPLNLSNAFDEASKELGRSRLSLKNRYYRTLRSMDENKVVSCGSESGFSINTKNKCRNADGVLPNQNLQSIGIIISHYSNLPLQYKQKVLEFLTLN